MLVGVFKKRKTQLAVAAALLCVFFVVAYSYAIRPEVGSSEENVIVKAADTMLDEINPFRTATPKNQFITEYDFTLSTADLQYFEKASQESLAAGYRTAFASKYRTVKMEHDGKSYTVGMSLFGDGPSHYMNSKRSFKIKANKNEFIDGKRRINFVLPLERLYVCQLYSEYLAKKLGLITPEYEVALVRFNGVPQGLYVVGENWNKYLLERNNQPGLVLIERSENWLHDHPMGAEGFDYSTGVTYGIAHITPFDLEISNIDEIDSDFNKEIQFKVRQLFEAAKADDQDKLETLFDLEQVAKVEAYITLLGQRHDFVGDNIRLLYDTTKGKFGIATRSEGGIEPMLDPGFQGIERHISTSHDQPDILLRYLLRNRELRNKRNQIIWELLKQKDELIGYYQELEQKYKAAFMNDKTDTVRSSKVAFFMNGPKQALIQNLAILEKQFNYNKCYINIIKEGSKIIIEIIPDSITALKATDFAIDGMQLKETINKKLLQADLGEEMQPIPTTFKYEIPLAEHGMPSINSTDIEIENGITGKKLPKEDVYIKIAEMEEESEAS